MSRKSQELLALERTKALSDFYWFAKYVFGNKDMVPHVHREMCDNLQNSVNIKPHGTTELLFLMPRGTFKSSVASQAYPLWRLLQNPDLRILITNENLDKSKAFLGSIKACIEENVTFRELFGNLRDKAETGKPVLWNLEDITVNSRTERGIQLKEPSISVGAVGKGKTGMHYDLVIADDLVSEATITTPGQLKKTLTYYRKLQSLLDPGGVLVIVGTRYSWDDLYGYLLGGNDEKKVIPDSVIVEKAIRDDGSLFFPERLSKATLDELRSKLDLYMFGCQYLNSPTNAENAVFEKKYFRYIGTHCERVPQLVTRFLLVDPSRGQTNTSDYTGIVVISVDCDSNMYVELAQQRRVRPSELADWLYDLHKLYHFDRIGVEQVAMQGVYDLVMDRSNRGYDFIPVMPIKTSSSTTKAQRIRRMEPPIRGGKVYFMPGMTDMETQLLGFPAISYDDIIDALSMAMDTVYSPGAADDEENKKRKEDSGNIAHFNRGKNGKKDRSPDIAWLTWR